MKIQSVAVFCGSKSGRNDLYEAHARQVGQLLATLGLELIYGGGNKGLMGAVANAALEGGATVTGVIPEVLTAFEHQHTGLSMLHVVKDMHIRKQMMYNLSQAVVILAGGTGTLDEFFEVLTWNNLSIHHKSIIVLNTAGFYNPLLQHFARMQQEGFLHNDWQANLVICHTPDELHAHLSPRLVNQP
jgi:uncharacterized protein (TIGR00730 family)